MARPPVMFSYALLTGVYTIALSKLLHSAIISARTYFHIPVDEQEVAEIEPDEKKYITWVSKSQEPSSSSTPSDSESSTQRPVSTPPPISCNPDPTGNPNATVILNQVLETDNLYEILGVSNSATLDRLTLRRAYLSRSRACHPEYVFYPR